MATGYYIYRGVGGLADIDWATPVGTVSGAAITKTMAGLGHLADTIYTYAIRPVYSDVISPDVSAIVEVKMDGSAEWEGNRPDPVRYAAVEIKDGGDVSLQWEHITFGTAPNLFGIYYQASPSFVFGTPTTTEAYTSDKLYTKTLSLVGGTTYWLAVTARTTAGLESAAVIVGPFTPISAVPSTPAFSVASGF